MIRSRFLLLSFAVLLERDSTAQTPLYTFGGTHAGQQFSHVAHAGDVNADGSDDVIVGGAGNGGFELVRVLSGASGAILHELHGPAQGIRFGYSVAGLGDVDSDGHADFAVGASEHDLTLPAQGSVTAYSGASGSVLYRVFGILQADRLGTSMADVGDVNGDGKHDLAVGFAAFYGPNGNYCGGVRVLSGVGGGTIHTWFGASANDLLGFSVDGAGDVDGDGRGDVIVGAPHLATSGQGYVRVYSGATGVLLRTILASAFADWFAFSVSGVGDVNGDGLPDFAVGAPYADNNGSNSGTIRVFSGATGTALYSLHGQVPNAHLGVVSSGADLNADGRPDFMIGAPEEFIPPGNTNAGRVRVVRGFDGHVLWTMSGDYDDRFGSGLDIAGDVNDDGTPDLLVGAWSADVGGGGDSGTATVFSIATGVSYCHGDGAANGGPNCPCGNNVAIGDKRGCRNSTGTGARLAATGISSISADTVTITALSLPPSTSTVFFQSTGQIAGGLGEPTLFDGLRCLGPALVRLTTRSSAAGAVSIGAPSTPVSVLGGIVSAGTRYYQVVYRNNAGPCDHYANSTNAWSINWTL